MKKTNKSPENNEVTPNKKKLKQARLPFMLLSDVSPKAETPSSRKRKLSVPDAVPVPKVGKLSKENSTSEELVVISDEDSKGPPTPQKQDKLPNPYVKLVDAARKKKLQKSKGQKKSKNKLIKKQTSTNTEKLPENDNSGAEDVEMLEVEAVVHQNDEKSEKDNEKLVSNDDLEDQKDENKETNNNSKLKAQSPKKSSLNQESTRNKQSNSKKKDKIERRPSDITETICIDDSNNSADVEIPKTTIDKEPAVVENQESATKDQCQSPNDKKSPSKNRKRKQHKEDINPKRSSRNKVAESQEVLKVEIANSEENEKNSNKILKEEDLECLELNSDIEMQEVDQEKSPEMDIDATKANPEEPKTPEEPATPSRSTRSKVNGSETNLDVSACSTLDESKSSLPSTPKQADKSLNESMKNLTPKQAAKRLEAAKKREEREKEKQEREKKRLQEKEERAKQRQEKEDIKKREREEKEEAKKKEREEKETQKKKEREEKEKIKEQEKKFREEKEEAKRKEKEEKEEQRKKEKEAREEERRKKQEALELEKQEQELKLKKTKEAFVNFFVPKQKVDKESSEKPFSQNSMLSSFTIKVDMRLAPTCRNELDEKRRNNLEKLIQEQDVSGNYLKGLKDGSVKPGLCGKTWPLEDKDDDDVMIVEDELPLIAGAGSAAWEPAPRERLRAKLLAFHENRRPPYWGTWRRSSQVVNARRPFGQEKQLDYEVDSDDDWEDEADGESLDGSAGGSDDEGGNDDYEVDNEVFVPHGYLSDEEATLDEEDGDVLSLTPETQKERLKHLEDEFESELKKPTEKLKPRLYGPLWETVDGNKPENCVDALWNYFQKFSMIMDDITLLMQPAPEPEKENEKKKVKKKKVLAEDKEQSPKNKKKKEVKTENKEGKKSKQDTKKPLPNQPGINTFLKKVNAS